jgi:hypothetical protein
VNGRLFESSACAPHVRFSRNKLGECVDCRRKTRKGGRSGEQLRDQSAGGLGLVSAPLLFPLQGFVVEVFEERVSDGDDRMGHVFVKNPLREYLFQHLPVVECELDKTAGTDCLELFADMLAVVEGTDSPKEFRSLIPADRDRAAPQGDRDAVEAFGHGGEAT